MVSEHSDNTIRTLENPNHENNPPAVNLDQSISTAAGLEQPTAAAAIHNQNASTSQGPVANCCRRGLLPIVDNSLIWDLRHSRGSPVQLRVQLKPTSFKASDGVQQAAPPSGFQQLSQPKAQPSAFQHQQSSTASKPTTRAATADVSATADVFCSIGFVGLSAAVILYRASYFSPQQQLVALQ